VLNPGSKPITVSLCRLSYLCHLAPMPSHKRLAILLQPGPVSFDIIRVHIRIVLFHPSLRRPQASKAKLLVQSMCVARHQAPTPQSLQRRMLHYTSHQRLPDAMSSVLFQNEHVTEVRERRIVGNHTCQANLHITLICSEAKRSLQGPLDGILRNSLGPVTL